MTPLRKRCIKMTDVPKPITEDQYDKLLRRIWELEQKYKYDERQTLNAVSLEMVFDQQSIIKNQFTAISKIIEKMSSNLALSHFNPPVDKEP